MKKPTLWIIALAASIAVFVAVLLAYNNLSEDYAPQNKLQSATDLNKNQNDTSAPKPNQGNKEGPKQDANSQQNTPSQNLAPDFTVKDQNGNDVKLSDYFGKPIVLNFWATWCPYCIEEMPDFEKAFKENPDVQFIMLNTGESIDKAKEFIEDAGFSFPVLYDTNSSAAITYGTNSLPTSFFFNKNGEVVAYYPGRMSKELLQQGIDMITQ